MTTSDLVELIKARDCDEQFEIASRVAANIGYKLVPEDALVTEDMDRICDRLERLEDAVLEINPSLNWK